MKPLNFSQSNCNYAEDQQEYITLPAYKSKDGQVISYWKLSWIERLKVLCFGRLWLMQLTFNLPLQPQLPTVDSPFIKQAKQ